MKYLKKIKWLLIILFMLSVLAVANYASAFSGRLFGSGHKEVPPPVVEVTPTPAPQPTPVQETKAELLAALSWELPCRDSQVVQDYHPERRAWSLKLLNTIDENYDVFMSAKDIKELIPDLDKFTRSQRVTLLAELFSTVAKYEASWNPSLAVKDVNGSTAPGLKATGLYQMNADNDQVNYRTGTKYTYTQLKDPLINIEVGIKIAVTVIKVRGKITFKSGEKSKELKYFYATLLTDTAYGKKTLDAAKASMNKISSGFLLASAK